MTRRETQDEIERLLRNGYDAPPPRTAFTESLRARLERAVLAPPNDPSDVPPQAALLPRMNRRRLGSGLLAVAPVGGVVLSEGAAADHASLPLCLQHL
jgi:hypothetical protein